MPAPPASASSAKTRRTSVTSTARACAMPAQTPAITRSSSLAAKDGSGIPAHRTARSTCSEPGADVSVEHEHARAVAAVDVSGRRRARRSSCRGRDLAVLARRRSREARRPAARRPRGVRRRRCVFDVRRRPPAAARCRGRASGRRCRAGTRRGGLARSRRRTSGRRRRGRGGRGTIDGEDRGGDEHERDERRDRDQRCP